MSAAPTGAGEVLLSLEQIENWPTRHLDDAATRWRAAANKSVETFEQHHRNVVSPAGTEWTGLGNDAAVSRASGDLGVVRYHGDVKGEAASLAESGSADISAVKRLAIDAIAEAKEDGFNVGDDLSVTDARAYDIDTVADRNKAAKEHAEFIRLRAQQLVATDALVGKRLTAKAAELHGIRFEGEGDDRGGTHVQLVDNKTTAAGGDKDKPGEKPTGAADPSSSTLADLMLPPEKPDGATADKPGDKPQRTAMDLLEQARRDAASKPGADPRYTHNPLIAPIVSGDPSAIDRQAAKVEAARQAVAAAQAKADASVNQAVTSGRTTGTTSTTATRWPESCSTPDATSPSRGRSCWT